MTEDNSPFNKDESAVSPLGKRLYPFQETRYLDGEAVLRSWERRAPRLATTCRSFIA